MILKEGWDITASPWGTWSTGFEASMRLFLETDTHRSATLRFFVLGFDLLGLQDVNVFVDQEFTTQWHPEHEQIQSYDISVPLKQNLTEVEIRFMFQDPISMQWLGKAPNNLDLRLLSMGLLGVDWVTPPEDLPFKNIPPKFKNFGKSLLHFVLKGHIHRRTHCAPVAQLDRAPDYESGGRTFESFRERQKKPEGESFLAFFICSKNAEYLPRPNTPTACPPMPTLFYICKRPK